MAILDVAPNGGDAKSENPTLSELVSFARTYSPFYKASLAHLPPDTSFSNIPVTDVEAYWSSASASAKNILTGPLRDGVVMRSGGSTGPPKFVYLTRDELRRICAIKANVVCTASGIIPGDRVANLSPMGGMYGSFMLNNTALMELPIDNIQLPLGWQVSEEVMAGTIDQFEATVILSTAYSVTKLASWLVDKGRTLESVRLILFTGEQFFKDTRPLWRGAYPNALFSPYLYGSVECGPVGLPTHPPRPDGDDDVSPLYKVLRPAVHMEIVDKQGSPITTPGIRGSVVATHLIKRFQPLVRYPVGDIAAWEDYTQQTFRLYGRETVALKISNTLLDLPLLKDLVKKHISEDATGRFQSVVRRADGKNVLVLRVAIAKPDNAPAIRDAIEDHLAKVSHAWVLNREAGTIAPVEVEYVDFSQLVLGSDTGKLKNFVEERFE